MLRRQNVDVTLKYLTLKNPTSKQMVAKAEIFIADLNSEILPIQNFRPNYHLSRFDPKPVIFFHHVNYLQSDLLSVNTLILMVNNIPCLLEIPFQPK